MELKSPRLQAMGKGKRSGLGDYYYDPSYDFEMPADYVYQSVSSGVPDVQIDVPLNIFDATQAQTAAADFVSIAAVTQQPIPTNVATQLGLRDAQEIATAAGAIFKVIKSLSPSGQPMYTAAPVNTAAQLAVNTGKPAVSMPVILAGLAALLLLK